MKNCSKILNHKYKGKGHKFDNKISNKCFELQNCLNKDSISKIKKSRLFAQMIGEIINNFIDPIDYKLIIICISLLIFFWLYKEVYIRQAKNGNK